MRTRAEPWTDREAMYVAFIGKLFLQMLKCIIIPLIIPSLISAVGSLGKNFAHHITNANFREKEGYESVK